MQLTQIIENDSAKLMSDCDNSTVTWKIVVVGVLLAPCHQRCQKVQVQGGDQVSPSPIVAIASLACSLCSNDALCPLHYF